MTEKTYFVDKFSPFNNKIIWQINNSCNFRCDYCFGLDLFEPQGKHPYSNEQIADSFNKTGSSWLIVITGGEPFLHEGFIDLLKLLTKKHTIAFSSNFYSNDIYKLTEIENKNHILLVNASAHFEYRNKTIRNMDDFVEKVMFLQNNGIPVLVSHVAYPPFIGTTENHFDNLRKKGVKDLSVLTFRSSYNGLNYPENYTLQEIDFIDRNSIDYTESLIARKQTDFYGHYCEAGKNFFFMDFHGNVRRCGSIHEKYGNLFENTFYVPGNDKLKPCTVHDCVDCYLGFLSVKKTKASKVRMFFDNLKKRNK